jgi:hypothetical protein
MTCINESLLVPLEAKMENYRHSTGSQLVLFLIKAQFLEGLINVA